MSKRTIDADADGWTRKRQATLPEASPAFVLTYLRMALRCPQRVIDSLINSHTLGTWLLFQSTRKLLQTRPRPIQMFHIDTAPRCLSGCTSLDGISNDKLELTLMYNNKTPDRSQPYFQFEVWSTSKKQCLLRCTVYDHRAWSLQSPDWTTKESDRRAWSLQGPDWTTKESDTITAMAERISAFIASHP